MQELFSYNWKIRQDWFEWCTEVDQDELIRERSGGMGSILKNLFHVADCEQIWINQLQGKPVMRNDIHRISSLDEVISFSELTRKQTESFLSLWTPAYEKKEYNMTTRSGKAYNFSYKKILLHVVTHEVHHIGQLSVWARETEKKPISSDFIFR
ncbi:DinB family protein [Rossellomorea sp. AcN35-11]|nr:DinB family protein [Rossellomorea aquimaris]WJV28737.1 DinB family protein [Rossellomorea sp. AcN35-11]